MSRGNKQAIILDILPPINRGIPKTHDLGFLLLHLLARTQLMSYPPPDRFHRHFYTRYALAQKYL